MCNQKEMRKELERLVRTAEGKGLSLTDSSYKKWYIESLGGEEFLKTKYPRIYTAIQMSIKENKNQEDMEKSVTANAYRPYMEGEGKQSKSNGRRIIPIKGTIGATTAPKVAAIYLTGTLESYDQNDETERELYDSCFMKFERNKNLEKGEVQLEMSCMNAEVTTFRTASVRTICNANYIFEDGTVISKHESGAFLLVNGLAENVEEFEVTNPRSYLSPPNKVIKVMYKNRINKSADYPRDKSHPEPYSNVEIQDNKVATYLPIDGTILLKTGYVLDTSEASETLMTKLLYKGETVARYSNGKVKLTTDNQNKQLIHFSFDQDWKDSIDASLYKVDQPAQLRCSFYCKIKEGENESIEIPFIINSSDTPGEFVVKEDTKVLIPHISFSWGCFGKDTYIRTADGSERIISQVKAGDSVAYYNSSGFAVTTVTNVITGAEKTMICIEAENDKKILVTENHPMQTKRGTVMAADINITDELIFEDGKTASIRFLYGEEYGDKVYNLETQDGCCAVIANGFVTGQWENGEQLQPTQREQPLSQEVKALITEMDSLYKELGLLE